jgi:cyclin B
MPVAAAEPTTWDESDNIQNVGEYAVEIFNQLFRDEATHLPRANYMDSQSDINAKMRAILIDWLVEVHMKYKLRPETLFLTVNLIDRYLTRMPVMRKRLQLVGVVAMFIAAKFEEIHPPEVADFVYITDSAYTKEDILTMECQMLTTINFQVVVPTAAHFMDRLQSINGCDAVHREVALYLIELALLHLPMIRLTPSHLVSAALFLRNELMRREVTWPALMVQHSRHSEQQLREVANELRALLEGAPGHWLQAVRKKYTLPQHHAVARMTFA